MGATDVRYRKPLSATDALIPRSFLGLVRVVHGGNEGWFPLRGRSVLYAKEQLGTSFNIPYFADAFVNGKRVLATHPLRDADVLFFNKAYGFKGAGRARLEDLEAHGLLASHPDLLRIVRKTMREAADAGLDREAALTMMAARVYRWCEDYYGPPSRQASAIIARLIEDGRKASELLQSLRAGDAPKSPGRPRTTTEVADFADCRRRRGMGWKAICKEWNTDHPEQRRTLKQINGAWRRRYGDKSPLRSTRTT